MTLKENIENISKNQFEEQEYDNKKLSERNSLIKKQKPRSISSSEIGHRTELSKIPETQHPKEDFPKSLSFSSCDNDPKIIKELKYWTPSLHNSSLKLDKKESFTLLGNSELPFDEIEEIRCKIDKDERSTIRLSIIRQVSLLSFYIFLIKLQMFLKLN